MFVWARHDAAMVRARVISEFLGDRLDKGRHLVVVNRFNEASLLLGLGVDLHSVVMVCSAEEAFVAEQHLPELRIIAGDVEGALRDNRRAYTYVFYEAPGEGLLTDATIKEFQRVLSHGATTDGLVAISFALEKDNVEEGQEESPKIAELLDTADVGADYRGDKSIDLRAAIRVAALLQLNTDKFQRTTVWEPSHVYDWELPDGSREALAIGPVLRGRRMNTMIRGDKILAPLKASTLKPTEQEFKERLRRQVRLSDTPRVVASIAAITNIPFAELSKWIS